MGVAEWSKFEVSDLEGSAYVERRSRKLIRGWRASLEDKFDIR